jgi:hypothetical protein
MRLSASARIVDVAGDANHRLHAVLLVSSPPESAPNGDCPAKRRRHPFIDNDARSTPAMSLIGKRAAFHDRNPHRVKYRASPALIRIEGFARRRRAALNLMGHAKN